MWACATSTAWSSPFDSTASARSALRRSDRDSNWRVGQSAGLLNHRIASKHDHRITDFQFREFFAFSLADFQIILRRIAPARNAKEANLTASGINKFSPATASFHFGELLFHGQD